MATTIAAAAALNPTPASVRPSRVRPQRSEREKRRAAQAKKDSLRHEDPAASIEQGQPPAEDQLDWLPLADTQAAPCPVVFSLDSAYCFVASGSQVKVYASATTELLSTLSNRSSPSLLRGKVSAVLLHPSNPRQLVVGSTDGIVRVWDYLEGKLLRTLDCQSPITHATGHPSLPDQLFVALANPTLKKDQDEINSEHKAEPQGETLAGVYMISLRPKRAQPSTEDRAAIDPSTPAAPSRRIRLALPRVVRALSLSADGSTLISLNPHAINICRTSALQQGFTRSIPVSNESLTTLAFHPTETYFATGNTRGQIRLWYNVLERSNSTDAKQAAPSTSLLHWHVHPISALSFTPNGAYLLSGGQEAVIVLWQLHTNHQEYVPRLGAPIQTLTIVDGGRQGGEQMVAARLADGSVVFVGSQRLKIEKTIAGLKSDFIAAPSSASRSGRPIPLAVDPASANLVLPSGHPSSLQFYSPANDSQVLELEVSPSNRVSSATDRVIEPTRVERVAFSSPEAGHGGYWMATVDEWQSGDYHAVRQLKFWRNKGDSQSFSLSTRVDRPHTRSLTSLSFSPSPVQPLLLTTSLDASIKLWSYSASAWHCRTALSRRGQVPLASSFSKDGSMFAVAFEGSVGVWSTAKAEEICTFSNRSVGKAKEVLFAGEEGTEIVLVGEEGTVCWDLLTLEEIFSSSVAYSAVVVTQSPASLLGAETSIATSHTALSAVPLPGSTSSSSHSLPFSISQAVSIPSASTSESPSLAVIDEQSRIVLVGPLAKSSGSIAPSRLPQAVQGHNRMFDEIFGEQDTTATITSNSATKSLKGKEKVKLEGGLEILDTPAHSLPPVKMLWRSMLLAAPPAPEPIEDTNAVVGMEIEGGEEMGAGDEGNQLDMPEIRYNDVSPASIADIFKARLKLGAFSIYFQLIASSGKQSL
ncbi:Nan1p [Sporobolomyces koalae]|uniref:Nan1p n=1 Tax=Sporobolomyces koalae TaxID=500713 RepID=UPI003176C3E9